MDLADLVYTYPNIEDPEFQKKISAKYEFSSLRTKPNEPVPKRGTPFPHQAIVLRYMLQYDRLFLIHEPGTGKTCSSVFAAENNLRRDLAAAVSDYITDYIKPRKTNIQRIYVLTRGPTLQEEFRFQIICKCSTRYDTENINSTVSQSLRDRRIHAELERYYSILTYGGLVREVASRNLTDKQIAEEYSNTFFIIDEPQYLADPELGEDRGNYNGLLKILHLAKNSKIMATTATPMVNDVQEIAPMLNLVLPVEKQLPLNVNYSTVTLEEIGPVLQGYISYIRAFDTGLNVVFEGSPIIRENGEPSEMIVFASEMGRLQNKVFDDNFRRDELLAEEGKKKNNFYNNERQISNFVFPNGTYGTAGFSEYVNVRGDVFTANTSFSNYLRQRENVQNSGCKFNTILSLLEELPGNHFIYSNSKLGSGAGLMAAVLKVYGYEQFLFTMGDIGEKGKQTSYCLSSTPNFMERNLRISKRKRFAIITPETSNDRRRTILEVFNSYENRHGDYIKVMIGPPVTKAGINLANVVVTHLLDSDWNESGNYQALFRTLRATSHVALLQEAREKAIQEGKDPREARVQVRVYRHVAVPTEGEGIDARIYLFAERKDVEIHRMLRILKQISIDCQLNKNANVRPGDQDFSPICDYQLCNYKCYNEEPQEIDYSSFNVLYADSYVDEIISNIISFFLQRLSFSISDLLLALPEYPPLYILMAVAKLRDNKISFLDRYGKTSYLREDRGYLYIENELPGEGSSFPLSFYTSNLIALQKIPLEEITLANKSGEINRNLNFLLYNDPNSPQWMEIYDELDTEGLVSLLETVISYQVGLLQDIRPIPENNINSISELFSGLWMFMNEPVPQLTAYTSLIEKAPRRPGRPVKKGNLPRLTNINFGSSKVPTDTEVVFLHTVYEITRKKKGGIKKSRGTKGRIRILKPSEGSWRDTSNIEKVIYGEYFTIENSRMFADYEVYGIYGIIRRADGKFSIRDKTSENTSLSTEDLRYVKSGRNCTSWKKPDLVHVMYQLEIPPPRGSIKLSYEQIMDYLERLGIFNDTNPQESFTPKKADYFYRWIVLTDTTIRKMCDIVYNSLLSNNRILFL